MSLPCRLLLCIPFVSSEQETEIRGQDLLVGIEVERFEDREGFFAGVLDGGLGLDFGFDLDELAEVFDGVECDGETVDMEPLAVFCDRSGRGKIERLEDGADVVTVGDAGLDLLARL